ncbi:unnamed protein product [Pylaiella littoralis]
MDAASETNLYRMYEKRQYDATRQRPVLPVTIVTGSLGAGKTTLLRKILRSKHNLRIAAVVNEYGSVDHDGGVLERDGQTDSVDKLMGGCVCCQTSLGGELEEKVGELLRRPDHAEDRFDYLVIETSGVSESPESMVRALDKTFGKLTRARLDSVVTVVDADALLHQLEDQSSSGGGGGGGMSVSMVRQLESADVILLNKADLLDDRGLSKLSAEVAGVNPTARVECCSYGKVPLHAVLDVEAPRTDIQGVSHERVKVHLSVSSKGGNLRTAASLSSKDGQKKVSTSSDKRVHDEPGHECSKAEGGGEELPHGHLREGGAEQATFTSSVPLSLARFQDWVCYGMPAGVLRVKGVLAFDEDRLTRSVFNMSGRRRLSFESDGSWQGPMSLHLVVIGVGIDRAQVLATLEGMRVEPSSSLSGPNGDDGGGNPEWEHEAGRLAALLAADPLFDAVPREAMPACAPNVVRFRFTGVGAYGIAPSQLCIKFGVDLDAINRAVLRAVNNGAAPYSSTASGSNRNNSISKSGGDTVVPVAAGGDGSAEKDLATSEKSRRIFLTCQEGVHLKGDEANGGRDEECTVLRYAVGGRGSVSLADAWPMLMERARGVMKAELGHVHFCNCFS